MKPGARPSWCRRRGAGRPPRGRRLACLRLQGQAGPDRLPAQRRTGRVAVQVHLLGVDRADVALGAQKAAEDVRLSGGPSANLAVYDLPAW